MLQTRAKLSAANATLQVSARRLEHPGFLSVWEPNGIRKRLGASDNPDNGPEETADESSEDQEAATSPQPALAVPAEKLYTVLSSWKEGSDVRIEEAVSEEHQTEPSRRFTEASLVKELERLGIGRPSTYARVIDVLKERCVALHCHVQMAQLLQRNNSGTCLYHPQLAVHSTQVVQVWHLHWLCPLSE
jgi:DNA topoisomerase IA